MIRLYGMGLGNGSYARVTRGVRTALEQLGLLDGVVPLDCLDDWSAEYGGATSDVAVVVAPQTAHIASQVARMGMHERRLMLLPLNSSACPGEMLKLAEPIGGRDRHAPLVTGWLTPSRWSAEQLRPLTKAPVTIWRHGVSEAFCPDDESLAKLQDNWNAERFTALHLTSTPRQRKGTAQLIKAWAASVAGGALPPKSKLTLVLSSASVGGEIEIEVALALLDSQVSATVEVVRSPLNLSERDMATLYRSVNVVVQPSRGEGFGMVPLEALCCGVPVVATTCSGHSEFLTPSTPGLSVVQHGPDARMDDGHGAKAPSVSVDAVASALVRAYKDWQALSGAAAENASALRQEWSWLNVMRQWAQQEGWVRT